MQTLRIKAFPNVDGKKFVMFEGGWQSYYYDEISGKQENELIGKTIDFNRFNKSKNLIESVV